MVIDFDPYIRADNEIQQARKDLAQFKSYVAALALQRAKRRLGELVKERRDMFRVLDGHLAELEELWNDSMREIEDGT